MHIHLIIWKCKDYLKTQIRLSNNKSYLVSFFSYNERLIPSLSFIIQLYINRYLINSGYSSGTYLPILINYSQKIYLAIYRYFSSTNPVYTRQLISKRNRIILINYLKRERNSPPNYFGTLFLIQMLS